MVVLVPWQGSKSLVLSLPAELSNKKYYETRNSQRNYIETEPAIGH